MKLFKLQHWHFLLLLILLASICNYVQTDPSLLSGELFGIGSLIWFSIAILSPIIHQTYVLICWRLELFYGSLSKAFGTKSFTIYKRGFAILILSRPLTITLVAISTANTLPLNQTFGYLLAVIFFIPAAYLFYSVKKYFASDRAVGIDHFQPKKFVNEPFVKKGIFKYTSNGMYLCGFFILYVPGLVFLSETALVIALFNHLYIWVHYYTTELPDIKIIYKDEGE